MREVIYPTLLQSSNTIQSNSWFDIKEIKNENKIELNSTKYKYNYINTLKIKLDLNENQKKKLKLWLDDCTDIYNVANEYIIKNLDEKYKNFKKIVNFIKLRKELNEKIKKICEKNKLQKHTGDYAVKHCVEMYKSAYSNLNNKNIKQFTIQNLNKLKRRKNLIIEPASISKKKNSFFVTILGDIKSTLPLKLIKRNSILQYDKIRNTFIIISPVDLEKTKTLKQYNKCGIDIGVRTFMSVFSPEISYEIGTNTNKIIDKINKKLDNLQSNKDSKNISEKKYEKVKTKYLDKKENLTKELHNKTAKFLLEKFKIINIGKVSTKKMISNLEGNLHKIVKRRLMFLSHYRFRMKLQQMKIKYNTKINEIDEYMTSKTCCNCKNIKKELKAEKTYECKKCKLVIDRDINASINIYDI